MFRRLAFALILAFMALSPSHAALAQSVPADLVGDWSGLLDTGTGVKLHLVFHVRADGGSTLDSPDQNAMGLPVSGVTEADGKVRFDLASLHIAFEAPHASGAKTLDGKLLQGGGAFPLTLTWSAPAASAAPAPKRPQTPQPPFPYRAEDVAYDNTAQHAHLAGTLTLPQGKGPFPVALLITGSGLQDRDETILGHKPFLVIADYLTRRGIAVLRVDDRSMGGSTGEVLKATSADFATDVEAGVAFLKSRPDIDKRHIGLIGHSEGGIIAPMVAAKDPGVAFIVLLAGPGVTGAETSLYQVRNALEQAHMAPDAIEKQVAVQRQIMDVAVSDVDDATAHRQVADILVKLGLPAADADKKAAQATAPWTRWWFKHDPAPVLRAVHCPVLALDGSKDTQVPSAINVPALRAALKGNPDATVEEMPGLNHLFQTAGTGQFDEYAKIEETFSPAALKVIGDWVTAHTGK
jgi:pimeloyl-ACP methyl ester carboxylesterase